MLRLLNIIIFKQSILIKNLISLTDKELGLIIITHIRPKLHSHLLYLMLSIIQILYKLELDIALLDPSKCRVYKNSIYKLKKDSNNIKTKIFNR